MVTYDAMKVVKKSGPRDETIAFVNMRNGKPNGLVFESGLTLNLRKHPWVLHILSDCGPPDRWIGKKLRLSMQDTPDKPAA